jgi:hypothetical protein
MYQVGKFVEIQANDYCMPADKFLWSDLQTKLLICPSATSGVPVIHTEYYVEALFFAVSSVGKSFVVYNTCTSYLSYISTIYHHMHIPCEIRCRLQRTCIIIYYINLYQSYKWSRNKQFYKANPQQFSLAAWLGHMGKRYPNSRSFSWSCLSTHTWDLYSHPTFLVGKLWDRAHNVEITSLAL